MTTSINWRLLVEKVPPPKKQIKRKKIISLNKILEDDDLGLFKQWYQKHQFNEDRDRALCHRSSLVMYYALNHKSSSIIDYLLEREKGYWFDNSQISNQIDLLSHAVESKYNPVVKKVMDNLWSQHSSQIINRVFNDHLSQKLNWWHAKGYPVAHPEKFSENWQAWMDVLFRSTNQAFFYDVHNLLFELKEKHHLALENSVIEKTWSFLIELDEEKMLSALASVDIVPSSAFLPKLKEGFVFSLYGIHAAQIDVNQPHYSCVRLAMRSKRSGRCFESFLKVPDLVEAFKQETSKMSLTDLQQDLKHFHLRENMHKALFKCVSQYQITDASGNNYLHALFSKKKEFSTRYLKDEALIKIFQKEASICWQSTNHQGQTPGDLLHDLAHFETLTNEFPSKAEMVSRYEAYQEIEPQVTQKHLQKSLKTVRRKQTKHRL